MAEAPSTLVHVAVLSKMLLEALENADPPLAPTTLLADLHELSARVRADLDERVRVQRP